MGGNIVKRVIGIYCGGYNSLSVWDDEIVRNGGAGGSETWAVEIASEFQRRGFHVIVFGKPPCWHFAADGVEYVPVENFEWRCEYQHFDYFIFSRTVLPLTTKLNCSNVYLMAHEYMIWGAQDFSDLKMDRVCKISTLSDYHTKEFLSAFNGLTKDRVFRSFNGINFELYEKNKGKTKENSMVWSSCRERGLDFLLERVLPLIRREVPDFKVKLCGYYDNFSEFEGREGVEILGKLGKEKLAEEQSKSKIWVFPNTGIVSTQPSTIYLHETFCITAVENATAGNAIVCFPTGGLTSTLEGYSGFIGKNFVEDFYLNTGDYFDIINPNNFDAAAKIMAMQSIKILKDDTLRFQLSDEVNYICKKYTWKNAVNCWLKEWGLLYE